jgi:hypothetical protein
MKTKILLVVAFAISILNVSSQNRVVLIEQFSNSSCGPCGNASPTIFAYANNNPQKAVVITYHTSFPYFNDSMYFDNTVDNNARVNYYSVGGVPNSIVDGNVYSGATATLNTTLNTTITNRSLIAPRYSIASSNFQLSNGQLTGTFDFTSIDAQNSNQNLVAQIVVIEKNVLKSSFAASPGNNSETQYGYVMRKMFPTSNGTSLNNTALNGLESINLNWPISRIKNINELRVVAFVQNTTNNEIYQAQIFSPALSVGISDIDITSEFSVYPNPVSSEINIQFNKLELVKNITVVNNLGQLFYSEVLNELTNNYKINYQINKGMYYVLIETAAGSFRKKIIVN